MAKPLTKEEEANWRGEHWMGWSVLRIWATLDAERAKVDDLCGKWVAACDQAHNFERLLDAEHAAHAQAHQARLLQLEELEKLEDQLDAERKAHEIATQQRDHFRGDSPQLCTDAEDALRRLHDQVDVLFSEVRALKERLDAVGAERDRLWSFALRLARCPCCATIRCFPDCTFEVDCPTEHATMAAARSALGGMEDGN